MSIPGHEPIGSPEDALRAIASLERALRAVDPHGMATQEARRVQAGLRLAYVRHGLAAAGIELTPYTAMAARWVAGQPLETIAVVLDWIRQAGRAGCAPGDPDER
jgi:hypothetical protein